PVFVTTSPPPLHSSILFPYTTLFRSDRLRNACTRSTRDDCDGARDVRRLEGRDATAERDADVRVADDLDVKARGRRHVAAGVVLDRKSTRLNSSHRTISYAVFCLKKK